MAEVLILSTSRINSFKNSPRTITVRNNAYDFIILLRNIETVGGDTMFKNFCIRSMSFVKTEKTLSKLYAIVLAMKKVSLSRAFLTM